MIITEAAIPNTRECLAQLSARLPAATIIMETGTHSPWVSRLFEARDHRVLVANTRKLLAPPVARAPEFLALRFAPGHA